MDLIDIEPLCTTKTIFFEAHALQDVKYFVKGKGYWKMPLDHLSFVFLLLLLPSLPKIPFNWIFVLNCQFFPKLRIVIRLITHRASSSKRSGRGSLEYMLRILAPFSDARNVSFLKVVSCWLISLVPGFFVKSWLLSSQYTFPRVYTASQTLLNNRRSCGRQNNISLSDRSHT